MYCTSIQKYYFSDSDEPVYFKYSDAKTRQEIGRVIEEKPAVKSTNLEDRGVCLDHDCCDGIYGLGNLIPRQAVTPALSIISDDYISQEEFDFVCSNSEEFKEYFFNACVFDDYECLDYFTGTSSDYEKTYSDKVDLTKYICQNMDGSQQVFLGYRCSYDESSIGYDYMYDILTGTIHYIGKLKEDSYLTVIEESYDNSNLKSVLELQQEFALICEEEALSDECTLSNEGIEGIVFSKDIYILDTTDENACYIARNGDVKKFYFLLNTFEKNCENFVYKDLNQVGDAFISAEGTSCMYINEFATEIIGTDYRPLLSDNPNETNALKTLDEFLLIHDMADLIHENGEYKMSEILEIATYIYSLNDEKGLELTPDYE